jgi:hypothetical protein
MRAGRPLDQAPQGEDEQVGGLAHQGQPDDQFDDAPSHQHVEAGRVESTDDEGQNGLHRPSWEMTNDRMTNDKMTNDRMTNDRMTNEMTMTNDKKALRSLRLCGALTAHSSARVKMMVSITPMTTR